MLQFFESKGNRRLELILAIVIFFLGILFLFFKGYFLGTFLSILGLVVSILSIRRQTKNEVVLEVNDDGITFPFRGSKLFVEYNNILKIEKKQMLFTDEVTGSYFVIFLKNRKKPMRVSLPDLGIDEDAIVSILNHELKKRVK